MLIPFHLVTLLLFRKLLFNDNLAALFSDVQSLTNLPAISNRHFTSRQLFEFVPFITGANTIAIIVNSLWILGIVFVLIFMKIVSFAFIVKFLKLFKQFEAIIHSLANDKWNSPAMHLPTTFSHNKPFQLPPMITTSNFQPFPELHNHYQPATMNNHYLQHPAIVANQYQNLGPTREYLQLPSATNNYNFQQLSPFNRNSLQHSSSPAMYSNNNNRQYVEELMRRNCQNNLQFAFTSNCLPRMSNFEVPPAISNTYLQLPAVTNIYLQIPQIARTSDIYPQVIADLYPNVAATQKEPMTNYHQLLQLQLDNQNSLPATYPQHFYPNYLHS